MVLPVSLIVAATKATTIRLRGCNNGSTRRKYALYHETGLPKNFNVGDFGVD